MLKYIILYLIEYYSVNSSAISFPSVPVSVYALRRQGTASIASWTTSCDRDTATDRSKPKDFL